MKIRPSATMRIAGLATSMLVLAVGGCAELPVAPEVWAFTIDGNVPATGTVGAPLSQIGVRVTVNNAGRSGVPITFAATAGTVEPASAQTDANGRAKVVWTLGTTPGTHKLTASGPEDVTQLSVSVTSTADAPSKVTLSRDSIAFDALTDSVAVTATLKDKFDNPATGTVVFSSTAPAIATVGANGFVRAVATGVAGIKATVGGASASINARVDQKTTKFGKPATPACFETYGDTVRLRLIALDRLGFAVPAAKVAYASRDTTTARVDSTALVTLKHTGSSWIVATATQGTISIRDSVKACVNRATDTLHLSKQSALPGEIVSGVVRGAIVLSARPLLIAGIESDAPRMDDTTVAIAIPNSSSGSVTLRFPIGKKDYVASATVGPSVVIADPAKTVDSSLTTMDSTLASVVGRPRSALAAAGFDTAAIRRDQTHIAAALDSARKLVAASDAPSRAAVAAFVKANASVFGSNPLVGPAPSSPLQLFGLGTHESNAQITSSELLKWVGLLIAFAVTVKLAASSPVVLIGVLAVVAVALKVSDSGSDVATKAVDALTTDVSASALEVGSGNNLRAGPTTTEGDPTVFVAGQAVQLRLMSTYRSLQQSDISAAGAAGELARRYRTYTDAFNGAAMAVGLEERAPMLPEFATTSVVAAVHSSYLRLGAISPGNITGTLSGAGDGFALTFTRPGIGKDVYFSFELIYEPLPGSALKTVKTGTLKPATYPVASVFIFGVENGLLSKGATRQLGATVRDSMDRLLNDRPITWTSRHPTVATVVNGLVTAKDTGNARIVAMSGDKGDSVTLRVTVLPVASVSIQPTALELLVGDSATLKGRALDVNNNEVPTTTITWTSSLPGVATVDATGKVTGVSQGSTTITASAGGKSRAISTTVSIVPVDSIAIDPPEPVVEKGSFTTMRAVVRDAAGNILPNRIVRWTSLTNQTATITTDGFLHALETGTALIEARAEGEKATAPVLVVLKIAPVASVAVEPSSATVEVSKTKQLAAVLMDAEAKVLTGRTVAWSSSDTAVATVNNSGLVTAKKTGSATVTATSETKSGTSAITVIPRDSLAGYTLELQDDVPGTFPKQLTPVRQVVRNDTLTVFNANSYFLRLKKDGAYVRVFPCCGISGSTEDYFGWTFADSGKKTLTSGVDVALPNHQITVYDYSNPTEPKPLSFPVNVTLSNEAYRRLVGKTIDLYSFAGALFRTVTLNPDFTYSSTSTENLPASGTYTLRGDAGVTEIRCNDPANTIVYKRVIGRVTGDGLADMQIYADGSLMAGCPGEIRKEIR